MELAAIWVGLGVLGVLLVVMWVRADRIEARARAGEAHPATRPPPAVGRPVDGPAVTDHVRHPVLAPAPRVEAIDDESGRVREPVTVREWLTHFHPSDRNVWLEVVREFLDTLPSIPGIPEYFTGADRVSMQNHFLAALIVATEEEVTTGSLDRLRPHHSQVRDSRGKPISPAAFDAMAETLLEAVTSKKVPQRTIDQVGAVLLQLREAIVHRPPAPDPRADPPP